MRTIQLGAQDAYRPTSVAPPDPLKPRSQTVIPGRGGPNQVINTPGGWAPAIPPYITYPIANVAWGNYDTPPFAPATFVDQGQTMISPGPPPRATAATPPQAPPPPSNGALPVQDWFNLLGR